jgi:hypothetical protein
MQLIIPCNYLQWYAEETDWNDAKDSGDIELFNFYLF